MSSSRVIVVANEKGGSGKSTVAMHIAIALIKSGQRVATIDLDARQKTFSHFIDNRRAGPGRSVATLKFPNILISAKSIIRPPRTKPPDARL
jgi:chromosome partitioning protein